MSSGTDLKAQVLAAALECSGGDVTKRFTFEELLVAAWRRDPTAWGLRGFERLHPDSERIHRELDSRGGKSKGIVALGYLEKLEPRVYRLTPKGLSAASSLSPADSENRERADRALESEIRRILEHPVFRDWLKDSQKPRKFREAGHFWGVAPGTPGRVIRERVERVEHTLESAQAVLDERGADEVVDARGRRLFDRSDVYRSQEFQAEMKRRFASELRLLVGEDV